MKIMYTKENPASLNIAERLREIKPEIELTEFKGDVLEVPTDFQTDLILVLSTHKSRNPKEMFTVHLPGNWVDADFGGEVETLNIADGEFMKKLMVGIKKYNNEIGLNWEISLEADHHGPTCDIPIIFVEIGSEEREWKNKKAGEIIAKSVLEAIDNKGDFESVFAIGGGHYPKKFNNIMLDENNPYAVGHMLPKYSIMKIKEKTFKQGIEKNTKKITKILLDRECNLEQKEKIKKLSEKFKIKVELI